MPNLPTVSVNSEQNAKILNAFENEEILANWIKNAVLEYVMNFESRQFETNFLAEKEAYLKALREQLKEG